MSNNLKPAVIVMRHFNDLPNDPSLWPGPYCYNMPNGPPIEIPWRRLAKDGIEASLNYGVVLQNLIQNLKLCPVSRVLTQDPRSKDKTQNPFDTIYPFLFNLRLQDFTLLPSGSNLLSTRHDALLPDDGHSTLICWDKQTLWGDHSFDSSLFLGKMRRGSNPSLDMAPLKAPQKGSQGIYVFTNYKNNDDKFDLEIYPTFTDLAGEGPQPTKGLC
ncbi:MAG: hypothetical protein NTX45_23490 [Proteobacteria bacterium]|nr:hypothetical protein [Pseudomonadota bacterium]